MRTRRKRVVTREPRPEAGAGVQEVSASKRRGGAPKGNRNRETHGLTALRRSACAPLDRRTTIGRTLSRWKGQLIADLGGAESISTQEAALVDLAVARRLV